MQPLTEKVFLAHFKEQIYKHTITQGLLLFCPENQFSPYQNILMLAVSGSNNSSVGSLFDKRTVSCSFPHELCSTKTKAPRLGDLPKSYTL